MTVSTAPAFTDGIVSVHLGDVRDVLRGLPAASVDCVVTSPPYWALRDYRLPPSTWGGDPGCRHRWGPWCEHRDVRESTACAKSRTTDRFYGEPSRRFNGNHQKITAGSSCVRCGAWRGALGLEPSPEMYVDHLVDVFGEVRRVLKPSGTVWLNLGDCYAAERSYQAPSTRGGPKHSSAQAFAGSSMRVPAGIKTKDLIGLPWRVAFALQADGWYLRADIVWAKPNPMPESVRDRPTRAHEYVFLLSPSRRYFYDAEAVREPAVTSALKSPAGWDRGSGGHGRIHRLGREPRARGPVSALLPSQPGRNRRTVWTIPTQPYHGAHFATFPERLVEPCILAGTSAAGCCPVCGAPWRRIVTRQRMHNGEPRTDLGAWRNAGPGSPIGAQGDGHWRYSTVTSTAGWEPGCEHNLEPEPATVLDPFAGSGTTLAVAARLGRRGLGAELSPEYVELIKQRCSRESTRREAA